ncbi:hypothetical protein UY3_00757, partial [Chelonia mydas]
EQWATLLAPYLPGVAQIAYRWLLNDEAQDYGQVKAVIFDTLDIRPETFQQWFHGKVYQSGTQPWVVVQELKDTCWQWLQPERRSMNNVAEQLTLEQFVHIFPPCGGAWVFRHWPTMLSAAATFIEDFLAEKAPIR